MNLISVGSESLTKQIFVPVVNSSLPFTVMPSVVSLSVWSASSDAVTVTSFDIYVPSS